MSSEQINTKASRTVMIMAITATFASLAFSYKWSTSIYG